MASTTGHGRETTNYASFFDHASREAGSFFDHASREAALVALAVSQHCVFSLSQAVELGIARTTIRSRTARHRLHRIHHGVYALVPRELLTRYGRWMAAVLACGPGAVLAFRSAGALLGLRQTNRTNIDVTIPIRSRRKHKGIDIHRCTTLTPDDVTTVDGIPCTTVARTLLDLAAVLRRRPVERAFDQAEIESLLDLNRINDQLRRNPNHRGASTVKSVLEEHYIGSTPTRNDLEDAFLAISRRAGAPDPFSNRWVDLADGDEPIWADFVWPEQRVIVETDGPRFHGTAQALQRDPRRDQRATLAGWRPIRATWRQVFQRPHELEDLISRLVRRPASRPRPRADPG